MSDLRVAYTIEQLWHRVPGGTATAALRLAEALQNTRRVAVVGVSARHPFAGDQAPPTLPTRQLFLPRPILYESWHTFRWPSVRTVVPDAEVAHATTLAVPPADLPLVVTLHDLAFLRHPSCFTRRGLRLFFRGLRLAAEEADLVLCSSRFTLDDALDAGVPAEKLRLVYLGVDPPRGRDDDVEVEGVLARYGIDAPYVLWVGTDEPRKNLRTLVSAWSGLQHPVHLVLVGPAGWGFRDVASAGTARGAGGGRMIRCGFVPAADLDALYRGASVFCYPSYTEGFGLPVLEAMVRGVPVVTSAGTAMEETVGAAGLLVDPRDASGLAAALDRVLGDRVLASELSEAGRLRAAEFTWEKTAAATLEAYEEVSR
ncbi:MAG: hypothetical protein KatS3mg008_2109 [Acidimicrobiales bacterium]|nr:MAG: hypothetical protein KatS3mg008_2109 [Acidimicrobiales bacterium]